MESYKHACAKQVVADWLRNEVKNSGYYETTLVDSRTNRAGPEHGVYLEYPLCECGRGWFPIWDEHPLTPSTGHIIPSYDECVAAGLVPSVIFDVAVLHKGNVRHVIEVVHKHGITNKKLDRIERFTRTWSGFELHVLDAEWVLSLTAPPKTLERIGHHRW